MEWWRDARFGMFIHWGLYSTLEGAWDGQTGHAEWIRTTARIPLETYDELLADFNPVNFDAAEWARMAKDAGMKYLVITTKHHDGFCLFDSKYTDFDVMSTPFKRDIMKEIADACRAEGIRIGWYHSIMDWHHPDYLPRRGWETERTTEGAELDRYVEYMFNQVEELLTNYGQIDVMWFDGEWESTWTSDLGKKLYAHCKSLQPDIIVNNRVDKGRGGMQGMTADGDFAGDFGTPEQEVPETGFPGVDWESCMTMNRYWGWNAADTQWKSTRDCVELLIDVVSKGGNLLLNIGPKGDGAFPDKAITRLAEIGDWMEVNGATLYGTHASPLRGLEWGRCTQDGDDPSRLYLHVFDGMPVGGFEIPGLGNAIVSAHAHHDPNQTVESEIIRGTGAMLRLGPVDASMPLVLEVMLDGAPVIFAPPTITAASEKFVGRTDITIEPAGPTLAIAYTTTEPGEKPLVPLELWEQGSEPAILTVTRTVDVHAISLNEGRQVAEVVTRHFERVEPRAAVVTEKTLLPGLAVESASVALETLPASDVEWSALHGQPDAASANWSQAMFDLDRRPRDERFAMRFDGFIRIDTPGMYRFALLSDDGSRLTLGDTTLIDNDGLHGVEEKVGDVALDTGLHPIRVEYFNLTGGFYLDVKMAAVGTVPVSIDESRLFHAPAPD